MAWHVYILKCSDGTFYTGATNDVARRVASHGSGKGAKYTRGRCPVALVWKRRVKDRGAALKLELRIKRLARPEKASLVDGSVRMRL